MFFYFLHTLKKKLELASAAEANKILYSIYELRKNEQVPDQLEINRVEHALAMLHFLAKEMDKVRKVKHKNKIKFSNMILSLMNVL